MGRVNVLAGVGVKSNHFFGALAQERPLLRIGRILSEPRLSAGRRPGGRQVEG